MNSNTDCGAAEDSASVATDYCNRNWNPTPIPHKEKGAKDNDWQTRVITKADVPRYFNGQPRNVGVVLGPTSKGLTDVDLDCREALALAPTFLPTTESRFGRRSKPSSHWLFYTSLAGQLPDGAAVLQFRDPVSKEMLLELRVGGDKGALTVMPGSVHESGEPVEWESDGEPARVAGEELITAVKKLAAASLLARHWPAEGGRHQTALVVSAFVARLGQSTEEIQQFVGAVAEAAGDEEARDRKRTADKAEQRLTDGKKTPGYPSLVDCFGEEVAKQVAEWLGYPLGGDFPDVSAKGAPLATVPNTKVGLEKMGIEVRSDLFKLVEVINGHPIAEFAGTVTDPVLHRLRELIHENFGFYPARLTIQDAVHTLGNHHRFHPVLDYLDGLRWDGKSRIDTWLIDYGGADDTPFNRAVGRITLMAAVRRVRQPGCKFDEILVLESDQGLNKSQAIEIMAVEKEWHTDQSPLGRSDKEVIELTSGCWIIEIAELSGMTKGKVENSKAFASRTVDKARMAYGMTTTEAKRQCVFIGTTNSHQYLRDLTGNRRFWPVRVGRFDVEALRRDRDQLWAEAAAREAASRSDPGSIRLPEELWEEAAREQAVREIPNPFEDALGKLLTNKDGEMMEGKVAAGDLLDALRIEPARRNQSHFENLAAAMRALGWRKPDNREGVLRMTGGRRVRVWVRGDGPDFRQIMVYPGEHQGEPPLARYGEEEDF